MTSSALIGNTLTTAAVTTTLGAMGLVFGITPRIRRQLKGVNGSPYRARFVFKTFDGAVAVSALFDRGRMTVRPRAVESPDVTMYFRNRSIMRDLLSTKPKGDLMNALLDGDVHYDGNLNHLARFSFLSTEMARPKHRAGTDLFTAPGEDARKIFTSEPMEPHEGVRFLPDPAFSDWTLDDWPRLKSMWHKLFTTRPALCPEHASLVTAFHKEFGFETDREGHPWNPVDRQGRMLEYLLSRKQARIEPDDLLLGTTTTRRIGVLIYPEFAGLTIWPELNTVSRRRLNPYDIDPETKRVLNEEVFPYWINRNVREHARAQNGNPLCQRLEERWVLYFMWKVAAISHTIPGFPAVLSKGLLALRDEAQQRARTESGERRIFHEAAARTLSGALNYTERLAVKAESLADSLDASQDAERIDRLRILAARVRNAPAKPARTFAEAVNAIWIVWICLHQENMNAGLSLGRLDQWLQPYLVADLEGASNETQKTEILHEAIELTGALYLKCQDHLPLVPDLANRLFGGSSSGQVITLGGVDAQGKSAVNDATYVLLKVTELLGIRDPNVNARYHLGVNPKTYLRRLVEVNAVTGATPSLHNDAAIIATLENQGFETPDARDWAATGCVEPTSCGRHMGHTNCMLLNLVAPLEITLHNGQHPLIGQVVGEQTGDLRNGAPETFEAFFALYKKQLQRMIDFSVDYNNQLGIAHQQLHPTPMLSSLIQGTAESGLDVTAGGAKYNSSGAALVALTDVIDSLMTIKHLVYERKSLAWPDLLDALEADFNGYDKLLATIRTQVPKFGGSDPEPVALAQDLIDFIYDAYQSRENYRGGKYTCGFWSMSNHVAFGVLSGALPSGRRKGKAFTPGITPSPDASKSLLDSMHAVSALDTLKMPNNIAFNVKLFPALGEPPTKFVDTASNLTEAYMKQGGMQMQFNIVTSKTLRDAMDNPAAYRNLLVRISGYNAYFIELNRDMQIELIERAEFNT